MEMLKIFQKHLFHERANIATRSTSKKSINTPAVPELLESLRCHKTDEYPVISAEDEMPIPPLACSFSRAKNTAHVLALVDENGSIVVYNTNKAGDDAIISDWTAHSNAIFDVKWMCREEKLLTASGDQTVCLWDAKTKNKLLTFKGHTSSVRSVNFRLHDDAVFASGSRDGHVRIWDVRCNRKESQVNAVSVIRNAHTVPIQPGTRRKKSRQGLSQPLDSQQSVTCVVFQDDNLLATGGAVDGCVKVWDVRKLKPDNAATVYQFPYAGTSKRTHGFSSLTFDTYMSRLFASCTDDVIYCYNFVSYNPQPMCTYRGHRNTSFYVKAVVSPDSNYLLSGSSDENAYIWQINNPNASPVILKGHRSEVSDVAWCHTDLFRIVTTSDDNSMRVWRYDPTVAQRKKLGQSDKMYDITGYAELTHRDIGVTAESSTKSSAQSPNPGLKRAATFPFGTITELTPKRSKTAAVASPSPSIKMWLKRSASDGPSTPRGTGPRSASDSPSTPRGAGPRSASDSLSTPRGAGPRSASDSPSTSSGTGPKQLKLNTKSKDRETANTASDKANCDSKLVENKHKTETESQTCPVTSDEKQGQRKEVRKSCKRKLEINENEENVKRTKIDSEELENVDVDNTDNKIGLKSKDIGYDNQDSGITEGTCKQTVSPGKRNGVSPRKLDSALQDLSSAINASPVKGEIQRREFSSPAAVRVLDLNAKGHIQSPTANLPNSVMDGPSFFRRTPHKDVDKKKGVDWLTQMRIQKLAGSSPKGKGCSSKLLDKLDQEVGHESCSSQENKKPAALTPKSKSPVRGVKPITSFFRRGTCAS